VTDPILLADLKRDEGLRLSAYPDPLSSRAKALAAGKPHSGLSGAPWTIGYGHTGPDVYMGLVWSEAKAGAVLAMDVATHNAVLARVLPWISRLDPVRRRVLQNMHFNMGWDNPRTPKREGLAGFVNTLRAIEEGRYEDAADGMEASLWYRQTGDRAKRLVASMRSGQ